MVPYCDMSHMPTMRYAHDFSLIVQNILPLFNKVFYMFGTIEDREVKLLTVALKYLALKVNVLMINGYRTLHLLNPSFLIQISLFVMHNLLSRIFLFLCQILVEEKCKLCNIKTLQAL